MAYRRRQGMGRSSTLKEDIYPPLEEGPTVGTHSTSSSLAAQAIMASAAHRDSSHSSAYAHHSVFKDHSKGGPTYDYTSMGSSNEAGSFWGVLARKAKAILDDDNVPYQSEYLNQTRPEMLYSSRVDDQVENSKKMDNPTLQGAGCTDIFHEPHWGHHWKCFGGRTIVENKTADFIQETRKIQIRRKGNNEGHNFVYGPGQQSPNQTSQEDQLKASRDVAMATAAKAKLLLRELKTVKADLAFAKQRCSQLEEENKILREAREKGVNPADDDMIRLQLETLLAEKARLAHENSVYARENRFLREIVEYHQLTMQDVVYLDEGIEEVTEVYPIPAVSRMLSVSPPSPRSPRSSTSLNSLSRSSSSISLRDKPDIPSASTTPRPPPPTQE
ncbi:hypothetical protein DH2020_047699 [Rehmannia glutinosa]|uniref:Uncharacterized protein n=1 Tax=Rehmannia glutinosa TaxID=99300 RepID=A0ABR0U8H8_REHGL